MKAFRIIFSFYLLLLAVQPCGDLLTAKAHGADPSHLSAPTQTDDCPAPDSECSPMCNCSCRQITAFGAIETHRAGPANAFIRNEIVTASFEDDYSHLLLDNIWQPPKQKLIA